MSVPIGSIHERDIVLDSYCTISCLDLYNTTEEKRKYGTEELFTVEDVGSDHNLEPATKYCVKEAGRNSFDGLLYDGIWFDGLLFNGFLKSKPLPPGSTNW